MQIDDIHQVKNVVVFWDNGYAEYANVNDGQLKGFKPVTEGFINSIATKTLSNKQLVGIIPKNVIGYVPNVNSYNIVFTTEAQMKTINHKGTKIDILFPKMIWFYKYNSSLNIYKIGGLFSNAEMEVIDFSNVSSSVVCIGTSPHPTEKTFKEAIKEIQDMFFLGEFNHVQKKISYKKEKLPLWRTVSNFLDI